MRRRLVRMPVVLGAALALALGVSMPAHAGSAPGPSPRIVGGSAATIGEAPWQVALVQSSVADDPYAQFCGGSIVEATWIVTAAHCVTDNLGGVASPAEIQVLSGTARLDGTGTRTDVAQITVHPDYDPATTSSDVAVLRLASALALDGSMRSAIALPLLQDPVTWPAAGTPALITGWGALADGGAYPVQLQKATISVLTAPTTTSCGLYGTDYANSVMLCAGDAGQTIDTCYGDSGGPLAVNVGGTWTLAGITSWGNGCATPDYPGVYTRVPALVDWIAGQVTAPGVPSPPRSVIASEGDRQVSVSWRAPATDGGHPVTGYTATATPGGATCTTSVSVDADPLRCTITGLTNGQSYAVRVTATNSEGTSAASAWSTPVTPAAPAPPPPPFVPPTTSPAPVGAMTASLESATVGPGAGVRVLVSGAGPGCRVDVGIGAGGASAVADDQGATVLSLTAPRANGDYEVTVRQSGSGCPTQSLALVLTVDGIYLTGSRHVHAGEARRYTVHEVTPGQRVRWRLLRGDRVLGTDVVRASDTGTSMVRIRFPRKGNYTVLARSGGDRGVLAVRVAR